MLPPISPASVCAHWMLLSGHLPQRNLQLLPLAPPTAPAGIGATCPGPRHSHPLDVVFGLLADELDALQHIGDVVDAPLLHVQHLSSPVQVQNPILRLTQEVNEFLGEQPQRCVIASLLPGGLGG